MDDLSFLHPDAKKFIFISATLTSSTIPALTTTATFIREVKYFEKNF